MVKVWESDRLGAGFKIGIDTIGFGFKASHIAGIWCIEFLLGPLSAWAERWDDFQDWEAIDEFKTQEDIDDFLNQR